MCAWGGCCRRCYAVRVALAVRGGEKKTFSAVIGHLDGNPVSLGETCGIPPFGIQAVYSWQSIIESINQIMRVVWFARVFSSQVQHVSVLIVGCGFTLEDLASETILAVTTCLGTDLTEEVATEGNWQPVSSWCNEVSRTYLVELFR